jgi:hypothetical protein
LEQDTALKAISVPVSEPTDAAGIEAGVLAMADRVWTWCDKANA